MKLHKREMLLAALLVVIAMGYAAWRFLYIPQQERIQSQESVLDKDRAALAALRSESSEAERRLSKLDQVEKEINSLERKLPGTKDMPGTFVDLYYLIQENRLVGNSVSFGKVTEGELYNSFSIDFSVGGKKSDIYAFITKLQEYKREISIGSISFQPEADDMLGVTISLKAYLQKDAGKPGDPADYDFMKEGGGSFKQLFDIFRYGSVPGKESDND